VQKRKKLANEISGVLYTPTLVAYTWIAVHFVIAGACVYIIALFISYKTGLLDRFSQWPVVSKWVSYSGALLVFLGLYFSTRPAGYFMIIPLAVQGAFSLIGWLALRGVDRRDSEQ
jgi:hypothetical protein